jgi:hypothetical protein
MAVAIWDHWPSGDELVEARRKQGWLPRPTHTVDGAIVLGIASCLLEK